MTPQEAVARLRNRDEFVAGKMAEMQAEGRSTFWLEKDREALALAITALDYLDEVQKYEASAQQ